MTSTLSATFQVSGTDLAVGEDPLCRWTVQNDGSEAARVPNPDLNGEWPRFVVHDVATGVVRSFIPSSRWAALRMKPLPDHDDDGPTLGLDPGAAKTWVANLSQAVELPPPGEYRVHAEFQSRGEVVRSTPATVRVLAVEAARSDLSYADDGFADILFQAWVGQPGLGLYLRAVRLRRSLRQLQCCRIAEVASVVEPWVSVAPNLATSATRSVVWLEESAIHAIDVGLEGITRPRRSFALPGEPGLVVARPCKNPLTEDTEVWVWLPTDRSGVLLPLLVGEREIETRPPLSVSLPAPFWIRSFFRSNGEKLGLCLIADAGQLSLLHLGHADQVAETTRPLQSLAWDPLGTAAHLDGDDTIRGVVVGQDLAAGPSAAVLYRSWSFDRDGRFSMDAARVWAELDPHSLEHFQLTIDHQGTPHALVQGTDGQWACLTPETWVGLEAPSGTAAVGAPMLRFMAGGKLPVVFWHDSHRGLVVTPVGTELPNYQGEDFIQPALGEG